MQSQQTVLLRCTGFQVSSPFFVYAFCLSILNTYIIRRISLQRILTTTPGGYDGCRTALPLNIRLLFVPGYRVICIGARTEEIVEMQQFFHTRMSLNML